MVWVYSQLGEGKLVMEIIQQKSRAAQLRAMAAQSRMRAIESQLALGMTLCAVAETDISFGRLGEVYRILSKLGQAIKTFHLHINEPNHVPQGSVVDLRKKLAQLEDRTERIKFELHRLSRSTPSR